MSIDDPNHIHIRLLSFDPGTTNMGWAYSNYNTNTGEFTVLNYGLFQASKIAKKRKELVNDFGQRVISLQVIQEETERLINSYNPDFVISEDTFFHYSTPQAHIVLALCIYTVEKVLFTLFNLNKLKKMTAKRLYKLAPSTIKMIMSGSGSSNKQKIIEAVTNGEIIKFNTKRNDLDIITEHEADAIAIGYTFIKVNMIDNLANVN